MHGNFIQSRDCNSNTVAVPIAPIVLSVPMVFILLSDLMVTIALTALIVLITPTALIVRPLQACLLPLPSRHFKSVTILAKISICFSNRLATLLHTSHISFRPSPRC